VSKPSRPPNKRSQLNGLISGAPLTTLERLTVADLKATSRCMKANHGMLQ
jgi:hypothetical protein